MMASGKTPPARKPGSKRPPRIRHGRGLPWLTIGAVTVVVALAAGIFAVVYSKYRANAASDAVVKQWAPTADNPDPSVTIPDIFVGASTKQDGGQFTYVDYKAALHINADQRVAYDRYPPVGGPHDSEWAACNGVVYTTAVRDENMVHPLEHGAVWIAYNPDKVSKADQDKLAAMVAGKPYMVMSPYPGLDRPISLQAWAHQLQLDSASDPRIEQFIAALRLNYWVYPETGATCEQPSFDTENPPAFDASPRGTDAIPMTGNGADAATDEATTEPTETTTAPTETTTAPTTAPTGSASDSGAPTTTGQAGSAGS